MNVTVAKSAGFCFGVKRAVNMVYEQIENENLPIYTYGPIIHNDEVVKDMEEKGVKVIKYLDEFDSIPKGIVIIRSHGISRYEHERLQNAGFKIMDATCPFVLKIHRLVEKHSSEGSHIIIIGNPDHPEVEGIRGWVIGEAVTIINSA